MFNLSGSELVFLLLLALIVLGPEKLPEAVRKFGKAYAELKKMGSGFQTELKTALDEPMREIRETADAFKKAVNFDFDDNGGLVTSDTVNEEVPAQPDAPAKKFVFDDNGGFVTSDPVNDTVNDPVNETVNDPVNETVNDTISDDVPGDQPVVDESPAPAAADAPVTDQAAETVADEAAEPVTDPAADEPTTAGNEPPLVRPPGPTFHSAAPQQPKVVEAVEESASE